MTWGGPAGVALVAVAVAMGVHGWGPAVLGLAALAWVLATPEGNLADRLLSYVFSAMAAVIVLGLAGPAVPSIFGPGGLAAAVAVPPAVAVARRGVRRPVFAARSGRTPPPSAPSPLSADGCSGGRSTTARPPACWPR